MSADLARRYALETAENNPVLRARIKVMIAWFEEHGWPRTAEIGPELANKMRSRNYAGLNIHCHTMPDEKHMSVATRSDFSRPAFCIRSLETAVLRE